MRDMIKDYVRGDLPSLSALLAVVAAGEKGGFTAAATALGVTQSAISREIRQIEESFHAEIFASASLKVSTWPSFKMYAGNKRKMCGSPLVPVRMFLARSAA